MKHLFIINPAAGNGKAVALKEEILAYGRELDLWVEIYETKGLGDGETRVREAVQKASNQGDGLRVYSCGGDGTLNEVVNGAIGGDNIEIGSIPVGTGNDFVRNFHGDFMNVKNQLVGKSFYCDAIAYENEGILRYAANMCNIGFDCNVVDNVHRLKKKPLIRGPVAYLIGALEELVRKKSIEISVSIDGNKPIAREVLMVAIGNGAYCGGGFKGVPSADTGDGLLDFSIIKQMSRRRFLALMPHYKKGTHVNQPNIDEVVECYKFKSLEIEPMGDYNLHMAVDGEVEDVPRLKSFIVPQAFKFIIPTGE